MHGGIAQVSCTGSSCTKEGNRAIQGIAKNRTDSERALVVDKKLL
jgi:hypothetical protein